MKLNRTMVAATSSKQALQRRLDAAMGRDKCALILKNVTFLDVFSCQWRHGDISIQDGVIVGLESGLRGEQVIDLKGRTLVPGFLDAHVHVESSLMLPSHFQNAVLPRGTTTAICDPHEIANVIGPRGIQYFLDAATSLDLDLWVMLSSCVPATQLETNGGGVIQARELSALAPHARALGLAEFMDVPGVLEARPDVLEKLTTFEHHLIDGHCPLLKGRALSAYATAGISSCHESSELSEAEEKLTKGLAVWIREGSVAKDLEALIPLLSAATSTNIGFCTDDRNPYDIATEGHIDFLIRGAIAHGVPTEIAYRSASWSVAQHYQLHRGPERVGAIAPGYRADLVSLADVKTCAIETVYKSGKDATMLHSQLEAPEFMKRSVRCSPVSTSDLVFPEGPVHVMGILPGKLITEHLVLNHNDSDVSPMAVLERYGGNSKPALGFAKGFGKLSGSIASSVGHDSHNLCVIGDTPRNMAAGLNSLIASGGGFSVVRDGAVISHLPLPYGGLMSSLTPKELRVFIEDLKRAARSIGCTLNEPFLQLAFLSLPVIPSLKLTDRGLVDVEKGSIIDVRASA